MSTALVVWLGCAAVIAVVFLREERAGMLTVGDTELEATMPGEKKLMVDHAPNCTGAWDIERRFGGRLDIECRRCGVRVWNASDGAVREAGAHNYAGYLLRRLADQSVDRPVLAPDPLYVEARLELAKRRRAGQ